MTAEELRAAAGGVAGDRRRMHQRRGHLHSLCRLAERWSVSEERPIRELARTLLSGETVTTGILLALASVARRAPELVLVALAKARAWATILETTGRS